MRQTLAASKPEPHHEHWRDVARANGESQIHEETCLVVGTDAKPYGVFCRHRRTVVTDNAGVIEQMKTYRIGVDLDIRLLDLTAPELKPVLNGAIQHAVTASRSHVELIP